MSTTPPTSLPIRAIVVDPDAPGRLVLNEVAAPTPAPNEALVRVAAISLNRGEVRGAMRAPAGTRPGWDLAGIVEQSAADGSGPPERAPVVGLLSTGAWAELVSVPTHALAELPESVTFPQAATLPVAGLTALLALEKGGSLLGRNVLVTGASGGVGVYAVQLARLMGAHVVGAVHQAEHAAFVREVGAHEVVTGDDLTHASAFGPYHLILESVGGASLATALTLLAPRGICVLFGASSGPDVTFQAPRFYLTGGATLYGFLIFDEVARDPAANSLTRLARLVASGQLNPRIEVEAPWTDIADIAQRLMDRTYSGKAVLHITQ